MAVAIITSLGQQGDSNGVPLSAGTVTVYSAGTTTPLSLFSDSALSVAADNPITLDSSGRHDMRYIATASYKIVVKNSAGSTIYTRDNIDPGVSIGSGALGTANGGTGATTAAGARTNLAAAAASDVATLQSDTSNLNSWVGYLLTTISRIASGTTAQEPSASVVGFRYNTTTAFLRFCNGSSWFNIPRSGQIVASDFAASAAVICVKRQRTAATSAQTIPGTSIPLDATIPQISEGTAITDLSSVTFTPARSDTTVRVTIRLQCSNSAGSRGAVALFKDGAANAVKATILSGDGAAANDFTFLLTYEFQPGSTSLITFQARLGTVGTFYVNTDSAGVTLGGTRDSEMIIEELYSP